MKVNSWEEALDEVIEEKLVLLDALREVKATLDETTRKVSQILLAGGAKAVREEISFVDADEAFAQAIREGRMLFLEAQLYMYMGTRNGVHTFKHRDTREYLK